MNGQISDLMRAGSALVPKCRTGYFNYEDGKCVSACALGAAIIAEKPDFLDQEKAVPLMTAESFVMRNVERTKADHPVGGYTATLYHIITDLNDNCLWSRERIADWLQSIGY